MFTELNDGLNEYGGSDEICCREMKNQLKWSIAHYEVFVTHCKIKRCVDEGTSLKAGEPTSWGLLVT